MKHLIEQILVTDQHHLLYKTGVYKITNILTNKIYIGSARREHGKKISENGFYRRISEHINKLCKNKHSSIHLQRSWNKTDIKNWKIEILEICPAEECIKREQYYLNTLLYAQEYICSKGKDRRFVKLGYNMSPTATSPQRYGKGTRTVYQYDLNGNFIKSWASLRAAADCYNAYTSNIGRSCKKDSICRGFRWSYKKKNILTIPDRNPLFLFTPTGTYYMCFSSYKEAIFYFKTEVGIKLNQNVIRKAVQKSIHTYKGFIWNNKKNIMVKDVEDNAIVFKDKKFIGVYTTLQELRKTKAISNSNWNLGYTDYYGYVKTKSGYEVFKRCTIEVYTDINKYYELLPHITRSTRVS